MLPKASLRLAVMAGLAGFVAGYAAHRGERRARALATLQGVEWFLSAGGASLLSSALRDALRDGAGRDGTPAEVTERFTRVEQTVVDRAV